MTISNVNFLSTYLNQAIRTQYVGLLYILCFLRILLQFADMNLLCSSWKWDTEAVTPVEPSSEFFEGPFLRILFGRMAQMTEQVTYQLFNL